MKPWAEKFYSSEAWHKCRASYLKKVGGLCEMCLKEGKIEPAVIVHHKIVLGPSTISNPEITLNFNHLQALCMRHHAEVHSGRPARRYYVDEEGHVWGRD